MTSIKQGIHHLLPYYFNSCIFSQLNWVLYFILVSLSLQKFQLLPHGFDQHTYPFCCSIDNLCGILRATVQIFLLRHNVKTADVCHHMSVVFVHQVFSLAAETLPVKRFSWHCKSSDPTSQMWKHLEVYTKNSSAENAWKICNTH